MEEELVWTTFDGRKIKLSELEHQHLSNILWFNEVFNLRNRYNNQVHFELGLELERRFKGVRLPWKPLPIQYQQGHTNVIWSEHGCSSTQSTKYSVVLCRLCDTWTYKALIRHTSTTKIIKTLRDPAYSMRQSISA